VNSRGGKKRGDKKVWEKLAKALSQQKFSANI
jgi:hypothetical protein